MGSKEMKRRPMPDHDRWPVYVLPWDDTLSGPTDMSRLSAVRFLTPADALGSFYLDELRIEVGHSEQ